ncbi:WD repeat-containing and planar cell polarity effector protein fritz-like [Scleropages formosus]|uniref:WD repeat-containing and planar cell polarity effector protein fritz-like n=1 Tax=Scleropages formosus TaxID=113540 RepID=A0A0P7UGW9_SCLFO|nr:WD repeat-containing and planar cell polarity effector protein fritz-like [Scleropages formosus]
MVDPSLPFEPIGGGKEQQSVGPTSFNSLGRIEEPVGVSLPTQVLSCVRTEGDPLDCRFSLRQPYRVLTAELAEGGESVRSCAYECARGRPQRLSADRVPVAARPVHDLLMLAFHGGPLAALRFRLGTLTGGQLGPAELVRQRLRYGQAGAAVELLGTMDWSIAGAECYGILATIMDHLFRVELDADAEAHMEAALGTFYAPHRPLSHTVVLEYRDPICKYARRFFHHLLRHQRFEKAFLLALDIGARDLFMASDRPPVCVCGTGVGGALIRLKLKRRSCCASPAQDIHHAARDRGELVLAHVAKRKAKEIDAEPVAGGGERAAWCGAAERGPVRRES